MKTLSTIRQHMRFLLYWGLVNCILSGIATIFGTKRRYFHEYNVLWNAVTLATYAGLRRYLVNDLYTSSDGPGRANLGRAKAGPLVRRTRTVLTFSLGLDLGLYPYGGGLLKTLGDLRDSERLRSYGYSMWFQGLVHVANSALWLYRLGRTGEPKGTKKKSEV